MSARETSGPEDTACPDRWILRSGEEWQELTGQPVALLVRSAIGQNAILGFTLEAAKELRDHLTRHIESVEDPCTYTFAHTREWCGQSLCRED